MEHDTLVVRWSHHDFDRPLPLVARSQIQVGDVIDSSHYGKVKVIAVHRTETNESHHSVGFEFARADGSLPGTYGDGSRMRWTERYPGNLRVPVYEQACRTSAGCVYTEGHLTRSDDFACRVEA